jgi:hypothetical protein
VPPPGFAGQPLVEPSPASPPPPSSRSWSPRRRPRLLTAAGIGVVAVVAALAFLLLGSGGTQIGGPVAQAATLSTSTPGYRVHMWMQTTSSALDAPITASGSGIVDLRDHAISMSLAMDLGDDPQVIRQLGSSTMHLDMLLRGTTAYVKLPSSLTSALGASRPWVKLDLAKLSGIPGLSSLTDGPGTSDPSQALQMLRSASGNVANLGQQRVDGVETTHYRLNLSVSRLADDLPASERGAAQQALSQLSQSLPTGGFPVDVWVDGDRLIRRVVMSIDLSLPTGANMQETVIGDYSDYGPQPPPAAPPANAVVDLSDLAGATGSQSGPTL